MHDKNEMKATNSSLLNSTTFYSWARINKEQMIIIHMYINELRLQSKSTLTCYSIADRRKLILFYLFLFKSRPYMYINVTQAISHIYKCICYCYITVYFSLHYYLFLYIFACIRCMLSNATYLFSSVLKFIIWE